MPAEAQFSLQEMLASSSYQRSLLASLIIGFTNGAFGSIVVLRKSALVASSLTHGLLPGVALGIMLGGLSGWNVFLGALISSLVVVLSSLAVSRSTRLDQGSSLAIILTIAFAFGVLLTDMLAARMKDTKHIDLENYLFGDINNIALQDLWVVYVIGAITMVLITALRRPILLTMFEPSVAAAQGVPVKAINYLLMGLLVLVMIASLQAVGCVLSLVILVAPAASVYLLCNSTRAILWGGGIIGAIGTGAGHILADRMSWRGGVGITLTLGAVFCLSFFLSALRSSRAAAKVS